jgi:hypothetical protein
MGPCLQLSRNGKIVGEYDLEKLLVMKEEGRIQAGDHLWMAGWADWKNAIEYLDAEQVTEEKAEAPKPKRKRAKRRRKKAEPTEATDEDEPTEEEEETVVENKFTRSLKYIGTLIFILITIAVMLLGHRTTRTNFARHEAQRRAAQVKASKEREAQAKPKPAQASAPRPTPAPITQKPKQDYAFTGFGFDGKELFASSVLAYAGVSEDFDDGSEVPPDIATYEGEGWSQLGVALSGVKKGDRFRVTITADRFIKPSRFEFVAETDEAFVEVAPKTIYDYETLGRLRQSTPFNVTYTVQRGDEAPKTETEAWTAHQLNDCQLTGSNYYLTKKGEINANPSVTSYGIAGFVNENHPWIDGILKDGLETRLCDAFSGYQQGDKEVLNQINAVWTALQRRRISYSSIATSTLSGHNAFQHVRFIDESITASQANCLDGCVVLASVMRKIGLNVSIILVPKHAYVAVLNDKGSELMFAVETTMLKNARLQDAIEYATTRGPESLEKIHAKLDDPNEQAYQEINIRDARQLGINPIPYTK